MAKYWEMGICNEKSGFLFNHACKRLPVGGNCNSCEKPVCDDHSYDIDGVVLCTRCAMESPSQPGQGQTRYFSSARWGHGAYFYGSHYYGPDYYGGYHGSSHNDRHDFTEADAASLINEADEGFESDMSES